MHCSAIKTPTQQFSDFTFEIPRALLFSTSKVEGEAESSLASLCFVSVGLEIHVLEENPENLKRAFCGYDDR
jgi:hypothetical protein